MEGPGTGTGLVSRNIGDRPLIETSSTGVQTSLSRLLTPSVQMATHPPLTSEASGVEERVSSSAGLVVNLIIGLLDLLTGVSTLSHPRCTSPLVKTSSLADLEPADGSIYPPLLGDQTYCSTDSSSQLDIADSRPFAPLPSSHLLNPCSTPPCILHSWSQSLSPLTVCGSQDIVPKVPVANLTCPAPVTDMTLGTRHKGPRGMGTMSPPV
jgi:hypothetical protein